MQTIVVVDGMNMKGRAAIEKGHTAIFSTIYKESYNVGTVKRIRFLRPDVAVVHIEWNLAVRTGGEQGHAINTMVMTKESGKQSIAAFQNMPIQAQRCYAQLFLIFMINFIIIDMPPIP